MTRQEAQVQTLIGFEKFLMQRDCRARVVIVGDQVFDTLMKSSVCTFADRLIRSLAKVIS
jgi:hypothetical protein